MNWRALLAVVVAAGLALQFVPAFSQGSSSSGVATVTVKHFYIITSYGFGVLNDSFTFTNPGSASSVQIPTIQVSLPSKVAIRTVGIVLSPSNQFSIATGPSVNGTSVATITPNSPTLAAGQNLTVALKAVLDNIMNYTTSTGYDSAAKMLVLLSPGLNLDVSQMKSTIILPTGAAFAGTPAGFAAPTGNSTSSPTYTMNQTAIQPRPLAEYLNFTETNQSAFTPVTVNKLVRTIVPSSNGIPMVEDYFSLHSIAAYNIAQIHIYLLNPSLTQVSILPGSDPPLLNPQITPLGSGEMAFADNSLSSELLSNSNFSLTVSYPLPSSMITTSGSKVTVMVPYSPIIAAPARNYTIALAPAKGIVPSGPTTMTLSSATPFTPGTADFTYTVSFGWAADQAIPAGVLVFAVAFALFAMQKPSTEEETESEEKTVRRTADVLSAFEEKTALEEQNVNELSSAQKGSVGKNDFDRMRNEISDLRSRALQRLSEMRQELGSGKQYELLGRVVEAEREEDRAFRDLLNLYQQYLGSRMNEETFKRLQPNYRKRLDSAINRLSDLLHETQTEEK